MKTFFDDMPEDLKEQLDNWFTKKYSLINKIESVCKKPMPEWEMIFDMEFGELKTTGLEPMSDVVLIKQHNNKVRWLKSFIRSLFKDYDKDMTPLTLACHCISVDPMYRRGFSDASHFYEDARKNALNKRGIE